MAGAEEARPNAGNWLRRALNSPFLGSLASFLLAIGAAALLISLAGFDAGEGYSAMLRGIFGSRMSLSDVLARSTPLLLTGLAVAVPLRAGLFNVGAEGQLLLGALLAAVVGMLPGIPAWLHIPLTLGLGSLAGALFGMVPAYLKARFRAHEVITTIMLNYIVTLLTGYLVNYPLHPPDEMLPATEIIAASAQLPRLVRGSQLTIGLFVAIACAFVLHLLLQRSVMGYEIRAVGLNAEAAEAKGIRRTRVWLLAMAIGGAMSGLAGATEVSGVQLRFLEGFSPGYGFAGIAVALMGYANPLGVILAAHVLGAIRTGALTMDRTTSIPADFVTVIQGLILVFIEKRSPATGSLPIEDLTS